MKIPKNWFTNGSQNNQNISNATISTVLVITTVITLFMIRVISLILLILMLAGCATTRSHSESGWEACVRNTNLAGMTSGLGALINLFCEVGNTLSKVSEEETVSESADDREVAITE